VAKGLQLWSIDHTGEVIGGFSAQPAGVHLDGWIFNNTAGAAGSVAFYIPAAVANGRAAALPSAGGTLLFTIALAATSSKEFVFPEGVYFKDGLFVVSSATTSTGVIVYH